MIIKQNHLDIREGYLPWLFILFSSIVAIATTAFYLLLGIRNNEPISTSLPLDEMLSSDMIHTVSCDYGTYMLHVRDPQNPSVILYGVFIGSSPKDLSQFCGMQVSLKGNHRKFKDKPFCTEENIKRHSRFCNTSVPLVDITEIHLSEK